MRQQDVIILYNSPRAQGDGSAAFRESDEGVLVEVQAAADALARLGRQFRVAGVKRLADVPTALSQGEEHLVINLVERLDGRLSDFNYVPAVCEAMDRASTGSASDCLNLTLDKWLTKARLTSAAVLTPAASVISPGGSWHGFPNPPVIVKPVCADGSEGIGADSVVRRAGPDIAERAARIHADFRQPALVERFIDGREFNVSILERDGRAEVLPISEIDFSLFGADRPRVVGYDVKWVPGTLEGIVSPRKIPADIDAETADRIRRTALRSWMACECRDYARIDMRMDNDGSLYVIEVNANPDISPRAGFPAALKAADIPFDTFIATLLTNASARLCRA